MFTDVAAKLAIVFFTVVMCSTSFARPKLVQTLAAKPVPRDPRQLSVVISDFDGTFASGIGGYWLRLYPNPGLPGFGSFSGLPEWILVPPEDYDGELGPRIGELLGEFNAGRFEPSGAVEEILLSNGERIRPAFYYLDPVESYAEFRPAPEGEPDPMHRALNDKIESGEAFLMDAAPFIAATFAKEFQDRLRGVFLTKRGLKPEQFAASINHVGRTMGWGEVEWTKEASVNLHHPDFVQYGGSKERYLNSLFTDLSSRVMKDFATPHFMAFLENDRGFLAQLDHRFRGISNAGVFANPVVPILVRLLPQDVLDHPQGIDWNRSRLESNPKQYRVSIYWPNEVEETDSLSRVFEVLLGLEPADAKALYDSYLSSYFCTNALMGPSLGKGK